VDNTMLHRCVRTAQVMRKCVAYANGEYQGLTTFGKPGGYLYTVA